MASVRDESRAEPSSRSTRVRTLTRVRGSLANATPAAVLFVALVGGWQALTSILGLPTVVFPSPVDVATTLVATFPTLLGDAAVTAATAALGLVGGTLVGLLFAFGMVSSRTVDALVHPYVVALRIAPLVSIAPLLFLWFGRGIPARALLVTTLTLFPVTVSAVGGLRSVPDEYLDLGRSVAAPEWRLFVDLRLPAAAPNVFAGVKLAAALSVVGSVVAEFVTLSSGLGYRVFVSSTNLQTARAYAALVLLVALGLVFYLVPARFERATKAWR
jgi:ABC-type nitrate/sulfonate/bicarbonate transport system permease component